ncbi:MAG: GNAT family N-acetyltransferase [Actinomycetota bacterium]|nr:GNAT family N-acetyltransferase [Actinomycetota bacterium]MDQ6935363.1 GNAT family N-acetyltransferase [Actinomycetota bacterium]
MLRPVVEQDVATMLAWRNQPVNREASVHQRVIPAAEHQVWWDRVSGDPRWRLLVFESEGRPLGIVSFFDLDLASATRTGSWGFYLDHETTTADGTAMLAWMQVMREATEYAFGEPPAGLGLAELRGEVRPENEAVRMMNRRFGFSEGEPFGRQVDEETAWLIPITLRRADRRTRKGRR